MATGRSDYPNQVNNVLGFPFIFRGALDVRASKINEEMKQAAVMALAELARGARRSPKSVAPRLPRRVLRLRPTYIIPKPFDPRMLIYVPLAVAQAAMDSGVARQKLDIVEYKQRARGDGRRLSPTCRATSTVQTTQGLGRRIGWLWVIRTPIYAPHGAHASQDDPHAHGSDPPDA